MNSCATGSFSRRAQFHVENSRLAEVKCKLCLYLIMAEKPKHLVDIQRMVYLYLVSDIKGGT
jgi:hypothetical protein